MSVPARLIATAVDLYGGFTSLDDLAAVTGLSRRQLQPSRLDIGDPIQPKSRSASRHMRAFSEHSAAKLGELLVGLVLASHSDSGAVSFPLLTTIAAETGLSVKHVSECVRALATRGEIEIRRYRHGRQWRNVYRLTLPGLGPVATVDYDRLRKHRVEPTERFTESPAPDQIRTPARAILAGSKNEIKIPYGYALARDSARGLTRFYVGTIRHLNRKLDEVGRQRIKTPPRGKIGHFARRARRALDEGYTPDEIRKAVYMLIVCGQPQERNRPERLPEILTFNRRPSPFTHLLGNTAA